MIFTLSINYFKVELSDLAILSNPVFSAVVADDFSIFFAIQPSESVNFYFVFFQKSPPLLLHVVPQLFKVNALLGMCFFQLQFGTTGLF